MGSPGTTKREGTFIMATKKITLTNPDNKATDQAVARDVTAERKTECIRAFRKSARKTSSFRIGG
jgi:hypothetical protein